jgi:SNF2 family DNA or RNA helicase
MNIPEKLIQNAAGTTVVYQQGDRLFRARGVSLTHYHNRKFGAEAEALIKDGDMTYFCAVCLKEEGSTIYFDSTCDCNYVHRGRHGCHHAAALLMAMKHHKPGAGLPSVSSLDRIISQYAEIEQEAQLQDGGIYIKLHLFVSHGVSEVEFSIGRDRMYILRNLRLFSGYFDNSAEHAYGKGLLVRHTVDAFNESCLPLLRFILNHPRTYGYRGADQARRLQLTRYNTDAFFSSVSGIPIDAVFTDGRRVLSMRQGVPDDLRLVVSIESGAARISLSRRDYHCIAGREHSYVILDNDIYTVDTATRRSLELWEPYFNKAGVITVSRENMPRFTDTVLPHLYRAGLLQCRGEGWEAWKPPTLEKKVFLEAENDVLFLDVEFNYGSKLICPAARDKRSESSLLETIESLNFSLCHDRYVLRGDDALYHFFLHGLDALRTEAEVFIAESAESMTVRRPAKMKLSVGLEGGLLALSFLPESGSPDDWVGILSSLRAKKKYHRLPDGSFLTLDDPMLSGLSSLVDGLGLTDKSIAKKRIKLPVHRAFFINDCGKNLHMESTSGFQEFLQRVQNFKYGHTPLPAKLSGVMRPYQQDGYRWLSALSNCGLCGILADEMGLGKTFQVIALLLEKSVDGPSLVVAPASLVYNWLNELHKFAPSLKPHLVVGPPETRIAMLNELAPGDIVITSYDLLKRDTEQYSGLDFICCVADEAQYIKNADTQNAQAIKQIRARHRFAMTGTPIENAPHELWSIFDFIMPGYLYHSAAFIRKFERPILKGNDEAVTETLRRLVSPFILRRLKRDVLTELPPKIETVEHAPLYSEQRTLYNAFLASARDGFFAEAGEKGLEKMQMKLLAILTRLRQICCHPALFVADYNGGSGKFDLFLQLMEECKSGGHRVLVFSQFTKMLDILQERLTQSGYALQRLDGSTQKQDRIRRVDAFNNGFGDIFLISLKAGGSGLNLTGADTVVHYDPWWNAAVQSQATDRAHRIGQTNTVQVLNLVTDGSVEEKIIALQRRKSDLTDRLINPNALPFQKLNMEDIAELLALR